MSDWYEVAGLIDRIQQLLADLSIRGLRIAGSQGLSQLDQLRDELAQINAGNLSNQVAELADAIRTNAPNAAAKLLETQTTLRVFERVLTKEAVLEEYDELLHEEGETAR